MEFSRSIELARQDEVIGIVHLNCQVNKAAARIDYKDSIGNSGSFFGSDFFYIMADLRQTYMSKDIYLLCTAGLINVFPGGLTSESSFGEIAYKFNEITGEKITVNIFDPIKIENLGLLSNLPDQKKHRRSMIAKLGKR